jgi:hypothetical protein
MAPVTPLGCVSVCLAGDSTPIHFVRRIACRSLPKVPDCCLILTRIRNCPQIVIKIHYQIALKPAHRFSSSYMPTNGRKDSSHGNANDEFSDTFGCQTVWNWQHIINKLLWIQNVAEHGLKNTASHTESCCLFCNTIIIIIIIKLKFSSTCNHAQFVSVMTVVMWAEKPGHVT